MRKVDTDVNSKVVVGGRTINPVASLILIIVLLIAGIGLGLGIRLHHEDSLRSKRVSVAAIVPVSIAPSNDALAVITQYLQAREDAVGADQSSQTSWISTVQSISTSSWYKTLESGSSIPTGDSEQNYQFAHSNNLVVQTQLSKCVVNQYEIKPTPTSEIVLCNLTDNTISKSSGAAVSDGILPATWTQNAVESPASLSLVKQNGKWLVNSDTTNNVD